jgi:molybdopterin molybdotransferase
MNNILTYEEAYEIIKEHFQLVKPSVIEVDILDSVNRLLAEDVISDIDMPSFDNSQMDGFAIKFNENNKEWNIIGEISAGNYLEIPITESNTVSIMTGAKLPPGADTIIPIENVSIESNIVKLRNGVILKKGNDVRKKGEDIKKGTIAVKSGVLIKTYNIPIITACGKKSVRVKAPLRIGLFATGDELIDIDRIPDSDKIRSSNLYSLSVLIKELNMLPVNLGIVKDEKTSIKDAVFKALDSDIDLLITTGGVSVGKYDYLKDVIEDSGFEFVFWKVKVKPGKPLLFCIFRKGDKSILYFGLPGNPVSSFVSFNLFIKPFISELYNYKLQSKFKARLEHDLTKKDGRTTFVRGMSVYINNDNCYSVKKARGGTQSSGDISSLSNSNCLIVFEAEKNKLNAGEIVECIMI